MSKPDTPNLEKLHAEYKTATSKRRDAQRQLAAAERWVNRVAKEIKSAGGDIPNAAEQFDDMIGLPRFDPETGTQTATALAQILSFMGKWMLPEELADRGRANGMEESLPGNFLRAITAGGPFKFRDDGYVGLKSWSEKRGPKE
jgi:hypothetical protein